MQNRVKKRAKQFLALAQDHVSYRFATVPRCAPVLLNSMPKAGTNLLLDTLVAFPELYRRLTRTIIYRRFQGSASRRLLRKIRRAPNNSVTTAHIPFDRDVRDTIDRYGIRHFLMVRDPLDLLLSKYFYVLYMHKRHPLGQYLSGVQSITDRCRFLVDGVPGLESGIAEIAEKYLEWREASTVIVVDFARLKRARSSMDDFVEYIAPIRQSLGLDNDVELLRDIFNRLGSKSSLTFRQQAYPEEQAVRTALRQLIVARGIGNQQ